MTTITREEALGLYGGSVVKLAKALGYSSRNTIYMWPKGAPIPREPYLLLRYQLKPEAFRANGRLRVRARAA